MTGKSVLTTVVGLIVGVIAALVLVPPKKLTTWGVTVDATSGKPSVDPQRMYVGDQVYWVTDSSKVLYIETEQLIFTNSVYQSDTKRYRVSCNGDTCSSGPLVSSLPPMPVPGYKYWQGLALPSAPRQITWYDGRIIIKTGP